MNFIMIIYVAVLAFVNDCNYCKKRRRELILPLNEVCIDALSIINRLHLRQINIESNVICHVNGEYAVAIVSR